MIITQIKNPHPWKFRNLTVLYTIIMILTFPITIWYWLYCYLKYFYLTPRFVNTFHRFGKFDPSYAGTEKYSLEVLKKDSEVKKNPLINYTEQEKNEWTLIENEIVNINMVLSTLMILNPKNNNHKWIIACHGWTENKFLALRMTRHYYNAGYNILTYDARNHGRSLNKPITLGYNEKHDLLQIAKYLNLTQKVKSIGIIGNSMGASTVVEFIKEYGTRLEELNIKWAVSDCGYSSLSEQLKWVSKTIFNRHWFLTFLLTKKSLHLVNEVNISKVTPKKNLKSCANFPLLIIHGEKDEFVPPYMAYDLYEAKIKYEPEKISELLIVENAGHVRSITTNYEQYTKTTLAFAHKFETK